MKKRLTILVTLFIIGTMAGAQKVAHYPIADYEEPDIAFNGHEEEWEALDEALHASWVSRDVHQQKHRAPQGEETSHVSVRAWRGERVGIEAVLFSKVDQGELSLRVIEMKPRRAKAFKWATPRFMNYVITDDGRGCGDHNFELTPWLVPDMIDCYATKHVKARETRPIWCTIEVPHTATAGRYDAFLEVVNAKGKVVKRLMFTLQVVDRTLPLPSQQSFHLDLWQQPYAVSRYHGAERWSKEHIKALEPYLRALARAGQSVVTTILFYEPWGDQSHDKFSAMVQTTRREDGTWTFDYDIFDRYVELCERCGISRQINCYSMVTWDMQFRYHDEASGRDIDWPLTVGSDDYNQLWDAFLQSFRQHLQQKGWFGKTCIAMDERSESQMLAAYKLIEKNGFKMALAGRYHPSLVDKLYDYCVGAYQGSRFTDAERRYRQERHLPTTIYTCCSESEPNIFSNSLPAEAAFLPLHIAANGLDGYLHWSWINWDEHPLTDTRFRKFAAGDTYCYYPGGRSSVRFERLIEGIQQYEKIQILRRSLLADSPERQQLDALLQACKPFNIAAPSCAALVNNLESFLNNP